MIEIQSRPDCTVVCRPRGDLDDQAGKLLSNVVSDLLGPGLELDIDLSCVAFIDVAGLTALTDAMRRVRGTGGSVRITDARPPVEWRLKLVGAEAATISPLSPS